MMRISLELDDFRMLVSGGIVERNGVQIALADIGWDAMLRTISDVISLNNRGLPQKTNSMMRRRAPCELRSLRGQLDAARQTLDNVHASGSLSVPDANIAVALGAVVTVLSGLMDDYMARHERRPLDGAPP